MSGQKESRTTRRSLQTLQHTANDRENLVGRPCQSIKHQLSQATPVTDNPPEVKRKNLSSKETQTSIDNKITDEDLTNPKGATEKYWEILAGKRQIALQDALEANEMLRKKFGDRKKEHANIKQMLEEAKSFLEVIKKVLNATHNHTVIDVVSTSEETNPLDDAQEETQSKENEAKK